ncbi:transglutaminase-like domain-containing protein [Hydrogenoanaerobacterium sp.]|uniref:transglutaminase-like domain-containing protein n=1 Tax=Hydrogenoanaerobacterium sp. TaxID=2953763 RepID=UPI00289D0195|nr:transglutaminase-like domain-containing protein [Hydrogenoanaerobacterium sp.]
MKKTTKLIAAVLSLAITIPLAAFKVPDSPLRNHMLQTSVSDLSSEDEDMLRRLSGTWKGSFYVVVGEAKYINDNVTMNFVNSKEGHKIYLTVASCDAAYLKPNEWHLEDGRLVYTFNDGPWQANVSLRFENDKTLVGVYEQYGSRHDVRFVKTSATPVDLGLQPQFSFEGISANDSLKKLREYPGYTNAGGGIPYTYELGNRNKLKAAINTYALDELMNAQEDDVSKMTALLNWVCNNFRHNGESGMPEKQDAQSVMQYSKRMGGVECRGLSIILSEMLRAYGVPAKSIKCAPASANSEFCHVVVHAYSKELKQWIMLDPTYRLILKNDKDTYVSLPMLRESLINGTKLVPNENAGRNGRPFYLDFYRAYMTQNSFHFSSATNFSSGSEGSAGNLVNALVPAGYPATYAYYRSERPTNSSDEFWKLPK